jgi:hypothetical protein
VPQSTWSQYYSYYYNCFIWSVLEVHGWLVYWKYSDSLNLVTKLVKQKQRCKHQVTQMGFDVILHSGDEYYSLLGCYACSFIGVCHYFTGMYYLHLNTKLNTVPSLHQSRATSFSAHGSLWTEICYYAVFLYTTAFSVPPQIAVDKLALY